MHTLGSVGFSWAQLSLTQIARKTFGSRELRAAITLVRKRGEVGADFCPLLVPKYWRTDSEVPSNPEDEVDFHYVYFVKSRKNGHLYMLDGDRKGPVDWGQLNQTDDVLSEKALSAIRGFMQQSARDVGFSLLALAPALEAPRLS